MMKIQTNTWVLMIAALSLTGFVYLYEIQGKPAREAAKEKAQQIFAFKTEQIKSFNVKIQDKVLTIERTNAKKESDPKWEIKTPIQKPANQASVDFLLEKLTTGKSDRTFSTPIGKISEFGLDQPQAKVEINLDNQQTHSLILGKPEFSNRFLYAQVDPIEPTPQNISVILVPIELKNAIDRPISEWEEVEKKESPSPTPTPKSSQTPTPKSN
jgi:hypothetical protein